MKTLYVFAHKAHEISERVELKRLSDTRWSCRYYAIHAIKSTMPSIITTLEDIVGGSDRNKARVVASDYIFPADI